MLLYRRNQHNIVKQFPSNYRINLKKRKSSHVHLLSREENTLTVFLVSFPAPQKTSPTPHSIITDHMEKIARWSHGLGGDPHIPSRDSDFHPGPQPWPPGLLAPLAALSRNCTPPPHPTWHPRVVLTCPQPFPLKMFPRD